MNVRFKKTDKGEIAILPRKEYEALAAKAAEADEDIGSARLVARARKEITAGAPLIPKEFVDRIANGENALRVLREWRDMTQLYLSFKTDIGPVSYTHLRAHETVLDLVCRLLLEKKKK